MLLARGSHSNLDILPQRGEKFHKALYRKAARTVAHECRDVRLLDAQDFSSLGLLEAPRLNKPVNLQRQPRLQKLLPRMRVEKILHQTALIRKRIFSGPGRHPPRFPAVCDKMDFGRAAVILTTNTRDLRPLADGKSTQGPDETG